MTRKISNAHHSYSFQSRYRLKIRCNIGYREQEIKVTKLSEWKLKVTTILWTTQQQLLKNKTTRVFFQRSSSCFNKAFYLIIITIICQFLSKQVPSSTEVGEIKEKDNCCPRFTATSKISTSHLGTLQSLSLRETFKRTWTKPYQLHPY